MSTVIITVISYEYLLQLEKEITFVWGRPWSVMTSLYLAVRYFGILIAMICACWGGLVYIPKSSCYGVFLLMEWGISIYYGLTKVVLVWRLYALYNRSKLILYVLLGLFVPVVAIYISVDVFLWSRPSAISTQEIVVTSKIKYCTAFFHIGPMPAIYTSIPVICYDIFMVVLALVVLGKHMKERKELRLRPNTYVVLIVRYHALYFVLNLATQIFMVILWANLPSIVMDFVLLFNDTVPFILAPRLIISIWETHAKDDCMHVSTTFENCACLTPLPPISEEQEMDLCEV